MDDLAVLLIDADDTIRVIFDTVMCQIADVRTAADLDSAAKHLERGWRPDVILIDPDQGEGPCPRTVRAVQRDARFAGLPVIVLTAQPTPEVRGVVADAPHGVVPKPFDPLSLDQRLRTLTFAA